MALLVSGEVPNTILENGRPGDWVATLNLSGIVNPLEVRLIGESARLFEATLDRLTGTVTIVPAMVFDREADTSATNPVFRFGLSVRTESGWQDATQSWSVTLLGIDDAPPRRLLFASGGSVLETDVGGVIGRLQGYDSDTDIRSLTYEVAWPDSALFEVVGDVLKLRDGVDLLREGGGLSGISCRAERLNTLRPWRG